MNRKTSENVLSIIMITVLLCSCFGKTPPAAFYTLSTIQEETPQDKLPAEFYLAVGPISIPSELDRPQIIVRDHEGRIKLSEFHRWAGSFPDNIASVLSTNLSVLLGTDRIVPRHHGDLYPLTHFIVLHINRFDGQLQGEVLLDVTWSMQKINHLEPLIVKRSVIHEPVLSGDYTGLVAAQSKALAGLAGQIADSVPMIQE
ncbi:MAG: membrane integrity-associated transporter subunit PqiC [Desulfobacteraceae bacterium]|nr:MAG: membrane integrity-associated transporter subunit PqiC [Desulfobacteraceae bacterium]